MSATLVSTGAATRKVWGGRLRSTRSGSLAQDKRTTPVTSVKTTKAVMRQSLDGISFSEETWLTTGRCLGACMGTPYNLPSTRGAVNGIFPPGKGGRGGGGW